MNITKAAIVNGPIMWGLTNNNNFDLYISDNELRDWLPLRSILNIVL